MYSCTLSCIRLSFREGGGLPWDYSFAPLIVLNHPPTLLMGQLSEAVFQGRRGDGPFLHY